MSKPTKILFTIPNFITAGSGKALWNIVQRLDPEKFSATICVNKKGGDLEKEIEKKGFPILEHPVTVTAKPYLTLYFRAKKLASFFKPYGFKIWHSFNYSDDYTEAIVGRISGAKWIYTKKNMNWNTNAWSVRSYLANQIIAQNSDMVNSFFSKLLYRRKTHLIHRGVDTNIFKPLADNKKNYIRKKLSIPTSKIILSCVANILPVKGQDILIQSLAMTQNTVLLLAGEIQDRDYFEQLKRNIFKMELQNRVHFLNKINDVTKVLAETDIFILPTINKLRKEGCPVALLEAASFGCICIASDIPGNRDIISHNKNGFIFIPENSIDLAKSINKAILLVDKQTVKKESRKNIINSFSIQKEVSLHEQVYSHIF